MADSSNQGSVINWAFVGTGGITNAFITGLKAVPGAKRVAVASRSKENGEAFAARHGVEKCFTNFDELLKDASIDAVYIGTPHVFHKDIALKAIRAKKAVLCEKPVTINAGEFAELITAARENKVFFMEAMWNRFVPPFVKVREWLALGMIGEVKRVQANFDFSIGWDPAGRLLNKALGGGALLDAGVYPLSLASLAFGGKRPEKVLSQIYLGETGVDEEFEGIVSYGGNHLASVSAAIRTQMVNDGWIYGTEGRIHIPDFVFAHSANLTIYGKSTYHYEPEFLSNGYNYEVEEVNRCIREGQMESKVVPLAESLIIMETMDQIRVQGGLRYPLEK
ncbi:dehydrogenase [Spirochaetia bacterium]|nr:dehydrogenase [Spirochaetia bacterium]